MGGEADDTKSKANHELYSIKYSFFFHQDLADFLTELIFYLFSPMGLLIINNKNNCI